MNQQPLPTSANWQIADGMTVYTTDGTKLGTVRNYDLRDTYLDVQKGWLFHKDIFVPLDLVSSVDNDGVTLHLTADELRDGRFDAPPTDAKGIVHDETIVAEMTLPGSMEPLVDQEDATVMRTADGRPIG